MAKAFLPKIVSANDLFDGDVVYLDDSGGWTRRIELAAVAADPAAAEALQTAARQPLRVIDPYLVDVDLDAAGRPDPAHYREKLRESGPSSRPDLGRQAARRPDL